MKKGITVVIFFIVITLTSFSQTIIEEGDVFGNWNISESPFFINGNITIPTDKKLSIEPGVEITFQGNYTFTIIGRITANGSISDSIIFTSADTTDFSTGTYNGWKGLSFVGYTSIQTEKSILNYCKIEYSSSNGIFCMDYSNLEIDNCSIKNNLGFGISINEFSDININDSKVNRNFIGGIGVNSSDPTISGFEISNNFGSGISVNGSGTSTFISGTIADNFTSSNGGGVNVGMDANVIIENVEINGNIATNGGGVSCMMGFTTLTNCVLKENSAVNGGGISAEYMASVSLDHILIIRNHASGNGGGINIMESDLNIINSTISDNTAVTDAGGMLLNNSSLHSATVINSIFWNNLPIEISTGNELPEISYSDIEGGHEGEGNIDTNPLFSNPDEDDYTLQWDDYPAGDFTKSPCIDSGNPSLAFDPDGTTNDMGAFYFDQTYITAVDSYLNDNEIVVYPNPATDIINIKGSESYKRVMITNLLGSIVKDIATSNNIISLNISDLKTGIYLMILYNQNGTVFKKKIVKR